MLSENLNFINPPPPTSDMLILFLLGTNEEATRMSKQAVFSSVIWSAMVSPVKPGTRLANSTTLMMHLVARSLNLSHRPRSRWILWSELEF